MSVIQRKMIDQAPHAVAPYSHIVKAGDFLFVTGQMPIDPGTNTYVRGPIADQAVRVMENLRLILASFDCTFQDVVSARVFLTDMRDFEEVNSIYAGFFGDALPARTCVAVSGLAGGADIEIDLIAYKPAR